MCIVIFIRTQSVPNSILHYFCVKYGIFFPLHDYNFSPSIALINLKSKSTLEKTKFNTIQKANMNRSYYYPTSGLAKEKTNGGKKVLAYDAISTKVTELLALHPRAKLYVTGHSLGGALATLFTAVRLYVHNDADESLGAVFTFGQPRVGNSNFARYMEQILCPRHCQGHEKKYFRVVFGSDIVPRVPCWLTHSWPCYFYPSINQC